MPRSLPIATDRVSVPSACTERWDLMRGDDTVRFCSHCSTHVTSVAGLTRPEIERHLAELAARSGGRFCVRYHAGAGGHPLGVDEMARFSVTRRPLRAAAGALSAVLALAPGAASAAAAPDGAAAAARPDANPGRAPGTSTVAGVVTDEAGAVIQGAEVALSAPDGTSVTVTSDPEGAFRFEGVPANTYLITVTANGFRPALLADVTVGEGELAEVAVTCTAGAFTATMGVVAITSPLDELIYHYAKRSPAVEPGTEAEDAGDEAGEDDAEAEAAEDEESPEWMRHLPAVVAGSDADEVRRALAGGDFVDATNEFGETGLMLGARDVEVVKLLLREGASVRTASRFGVTPLMYALQNRENETLRLLLKRGADPNAADVDGVTPLMMAAVDGNDGAVRILLRAGADPAARDAKGDTALDYARRSDDEDVAKRLRRAAR